MLSTPSFLDIHSVGPQAKTTSAQWQALALTVPVVESHARIKRPKRDDGLRSLFSTQISPATLTLWLPYIGNGPHLEVYRQDKAHVRHPASLIIGFLFH